MLYRTPKEIQKALDENRAVLIKESDKIIGFAFWYNHKNWCEISNLFVDPAFRGQGYFTKILQELVDRLAGQNKNFFVFTFHPAVIKQITKYNFVQASYFSIPPHVWIPYIISLLHPSRIPSYLKIWAKDSFFKFKLYIRRAS